MKRVILAVFLVLMLLPELLPVAETAPDDAGADGSEFVFARLVYGSGFRGWGRRGRGSWATDWPKADKQFIFGVDRLSNVRVVMDDDVAIEIMDPKLFSYPFMYAVEVGHMELSEQEAARLREYMDRGGFLVVDDFWGTYEWQNFTYNMKMIFPDKEAEQIRCRIQFSMRSTISTRSFRSRTTETGVEAGERPNRMGMSPMQWRFSTTKGDR